MAFVEFADVSKIYQMGEVEVAAVRDMSFTIERGEFVVIVGPSGRRQDDAFEHARRHGLGHLRHHHAGWRACELVQPQAAHPVPPPRHRLRLPVLQLWCRT